MSAKPVKKAKTTICKVLPSAIALIGFEGIIFTNKSLSVLFSWCSCRLVRSIVNPIPGSKILAKVKPIVTANAVVKTYIKNALVPNLPKALASLTLVTPFNIENNINGTTTILIILRNTSPNGFKSWAYSPPKIPNNIPRTIPIITFCQSLSFFFIEPLF